MDFYSWIRSVPLSASCFTEKCDCFHNHSDIMLFRKHIMKCVNTSDMQLIVVWIMGIFLWSKIFQAILALPP